MNTACWLMLFFLKQQKITRSSQHAISTLKKKDVGDKMKMCKLAYSSPWHFLKDMNPKIHKFLIGQTVLDSATREPHDLLTHMCLLLMADFCC